MAPDNNPIVAKMLIDQNTATQEKMNKLIDAQHETELMVQELCGSLKTLTKIHEACTNERKKNTEEREKRVIEEKQRSRYTSTAWALALIFIGGVIGSFAKDFYEAAKTKARHKRPYQTEPTQNNRRAMAPSETSYQKGD